MRKKPKLTEQEKRDIVQWNVNMITSAISGIVDDRITHHTLSADEAGVIGKCPFFAAITRAFAFRVVVGDRQMTEDEVYKIANEIVDERINRIRKFN